MDGVVFFVLKIFVIAAIAMALGYKSGLFSLGSLASVLIMLALGSLFSLELYASFFRNDISLLIIFRSSFWNFTLDLSFFLRVFLGTLLLGLVCSCFGVKPSARLSSAKDLCVLALLIAITVLLAVYGTVRIGAGIKISFKFISVFLTAVFFGPLWGGAVAAIADVIAFVLNPVGGVFMPQITMVEFLHGFVYGLFFFGVNGWHGFNTMLRIVICVVLQVAVLTLGLATYFLMPLMNMSFGALLAMRSVSGLISMAAQLIVLTFFSKYMSALRKAIR